MWIERILRGVDHFRSVKS